MIEWELVVVCENGHTTTPAIIRPEVDRGGDLVGGYVGSGADFCVECDALIETVLGPRPFG